MFVDFNILNQLGSPSINSNTFANRPPAGQIGRLFVSTDTFEIYRDNGTTWDLIGGPGSSTITGTGTATQVAYFTSSQSIGSSSNLFWDATNNRLGLGTQTPGARLDIHSAADVGLQLNGTGASPSILQEFFSAGVAEYDLGYVWNADVNYQRFRINDVSGAKEVLTIDKQSRFVGINYQYSSLVDQPAYTFDVEGSGRFTNSAYFVSSGSGQVGINTLAPTATALMQVDKTDGYGLHLNYTTNAGTGSTATALWTLNTTNSSGYSAVIEEKSPNTTAGQYPLLIKHSLSAGTAGVGIGTGIHFQLPDDAGTFRTTQLTIETTDAAAATYTSRYRFMAQVSGTSTALAYLTSTGLGINGIPTRALELFTNTSSQTAALVLNNATTTPKGYLGTFTNNLYITHGGTFNGAWIADGTNAIGAILIGANNNASTIAFQTSNVNGAAPSTKMSITQDGSVGIGTTGPLYQLDLGGGTTIAERLRLQRGSDDTAQYATFGYNQINVYRVTTPLSSPQTDFSINQVGSDGSRTPFYISSGGNVGIGTTSPNSKLVIAGTTSAITRITGSDSTAFSSSTFWSDQAPLLIINNTSSTANTVAGIKFELGNTNAAAAIGAIQETSNSAAGLVFTTGGLSSGSNNPERMRITSGGNVGIGTNNPNTALSIVANHVSGQSILKIQPTTAYASSGLSSIGFNDSDGTRKGIVYQNSDGLQLETTTAVPIILSTNGNEKMRITSGGNVLIGTQTDAGQKLQVNGEITGTNLILTGNVNIGNGNVLSCGSSIGTIYVYAGATYPGGTIESNGGIASTNAGTLLFRSGTGTGTQSERLRIHADGGLKFVPQSAAPTAEAGTVYYDSDDNKLKLYDGTNWVDLN